MYSRENANDARIAKVLTEDEARRIASNIAANLTREKWLKASASVGAPSSTSPLVEIEAVAAGLVNGL